MSYYHKASDRLPQPDSIEPVIIHPFLGEGETDYGIVTENDARDLLDSEAHWMKVDPRSFRFINFDPPEPCDHTLVIAFFPQRPANCPTKYKVVSVNRVVSGEMARLGCSMWAPLALAPVVLRKCA